MTDLEAQFEQDMVEKVYRAAGRETGYWAGYFLRSVKQRGGVGAARRLLQRGGVSKGLAKLASLKRLDLAMETLILDPAYQPLFTDAERAVAAQRLDEAGRLTGGTPRPSPNPKIGRGSIDD
jgi:5-methylcytosine-specific restriction protein A